MSESLQREVEFLREEVKRLRAELDAERQKAQPQASTEPLLYGPINLESVCKHGVPINGACASCSEDLDAAIRKSKKRSELRSAMCGH